MTVPVTCVELIEAHRDRVGGDLEYLVDGTQRLTVSQFSVEVAPIVTRLTAETERGDRVAVVIPNRWEILAVFEAVWRSDAVVVPLLPSSPPDQVARALRHAGPRAVVADASTRPLVQEAVSQAGVHVPVIDIDADRPLASGDGDEGDERAPAPGDLVAILGHGDVCRDELRAWCAAHLTGARTVDEVYLVEYIPLTPIGKPDRHRLAGLLDKEQDAWT
ncbi:AMP-binding protein [Nonomuraea sp. H19]|uniref:AMP-binding protein n=1 Tax=Nonomuraea sp. H19 TaxID=3452206 RepID=UPI003F88C653